MSRFFGVFAVLFTSSLTVPVLFADHGGSGPGEEILRVMKEGFAAVNGRLGRMDQSIGRLGRRMETLEERVGALEGGRYRAAVGAGKKYHVEHERRAPPSPPTYDDRPRHDEGRLAAALERQNQMLTQMVLQGGGQAADSSTRIANYATAAASLFSLLRGNRGGYGGYSVGRVVPFPQTVPVYNMNYNYTGGAGAVAEAAAVMAPPLPPLPPPTMGGGTPGGVGTIVPFFGGH